MELLAFGKTGWGDELFYATLMTLAVSITAMLIGFLFSLIFTPLKLSNNKFFNFIGNSYTTIIRGVPELLVIYLLFFGGSGAIMYVASIFGYFEYIEINAFITGSFAIGIISGAYSTEVFRGAIQSIDKGQFEAAKVLGVKKNIQFFKIIMPQMLRLAIPNLSNVWQITLKDTSLISVTGLVEIMRQSYIAAGSTRDPLLFYSVAAVIYLMLTFLSMKLIDKLEVKYSRGFKWI
jgi:octopine/nopaline transport system permease protein